VLALVLSVCRDAEHSVPRPVQFGVARS
jgi:hypothetical protein